MAKRLMRFVLAGIVGIGVVACSGDDDDDTTGPAPEVFVATLIGAEEVPPVTTTATGNARVVFTPTGLEWTVNVSNISDILNGQAHIHASPTAVRGQTAGVIVNLDPDNRVTNGLLAAGSTAATNSTAIRMDSLKVLIRAGLAYVNVHTTPNPGGHIRGQLVPGQ